ncbi:hypothetical protein SNE40_019088 [Patella caerulea]|uniref:3'-5' exonuclease n=1 Tax=Patella caerulea TaxID=87958 RepID=A0AAN8J9X2_PATCE
MNSLKCGQKKKRKLPAWMGTVYDEPKSQKEPEKLSDDKSACNPETQNTKQTFQQQKGETCASLKSFKPTETIDDIISKSLPYMEFKGSIIYSYNINDCCLLCDDLLESLNPEEDFFVGFDIEWPVTYQKGNPGKVSLIQICVSEQKCFLFHVAAMPEFPKILKNLIENQKIKKIGLNIENDFWKLAKDCDINAMSIIRHSMLELKTLANTKLKSSENWSLDGLVKNVLRMKLNKEGSIRCGNWANFPLSEEQQKYAAIDAFASLKLYNILQKK